MPQNIRGELKVGGRLAARLTIDRPERIRGAWLYHGRLLEADNFWLGREGPFEFKITTEKRVRRYADAVIVSRNGDGMVIKVTREV